MLEVVSNCNLLGKMRAITTDNASAILSVITKFIDMLNIMNNISLIVDDIHVRCIPHVVNLEFNNCLADVHENVNKSRSLLSTMRSIV